MLSTIILNWNRAHLLRRTVESYLATTGGANVQLFVVDNASTDESRQFLENLERSRHGVRVMLCEENIGGEAFNLAIAEASGEFIHLSENDQEFLPGWLDHVWEAFDMFPDLGQLSLHHDVPEDEEAWVAKPSHLRFKAGKILYEAHANVGTSSVLRGVLFRQHGIKVQNLEHGRFKFPADGQLSKDVKSAGYWVAWSDRYYVRNLGHYVTEFDSNPEYYRANYQSKPWLGQDGWQERIEQQRRIPRFSRHSFLLPGVVALPEKTTQDVDGRPARLWSMLDSYTAEVEVLEFLYALVRLVKPKRALETGTWVGWAACAIGEALVANGFGRLTTLEINPEAYDVATQRVNARGLCGWVDLRLQSSLDFVPERGSVDFALFDSEVSLREGEFRRYRPWLADGAVVVFHDTAPHHQVVGEAVRRLIAEGLLTGLSLPTPRGIFVGRCVR